jgi:hypothetical protein
MGSDLQEAALQESGQQALPIEGPLESPSEND